MKINAPGGVNPTVKTVERPIEMEMNKPVRPMTKSEKASLEGKKVDNKKMDEYDKDVNESEDVINDEMLNKSIDQANKTLEMYHRRIDRSVHEVTKTIIYTIKDTETNEIIQEFPPRKIQDMIAKMWELAGLFVDEKA